MSFFFFFLGCRSFHELFQLLSKELLGWEDSCMSFCSICDCAMEVENYLTAKATAEPLALLIPFCQQCQLVLQEVNVSEERLCESYGLI